MDRSVALDGIQHALSVGGHFGQGLRLTESLKLSQINGIGPQSRFGLFQTLETYFGTKIPYRLKRRPCTVRDLTNHLETVQVC